MNLIAMPLGGTHLSPKHTGFSSTRLCNNYLFLLLINIHLAVS